MEMEPYFRIIPDNVKILTKLCFYNKKKGIKYLYSMDRIFSLGFNRNLLQDFVHPPSSIELCKSREINERDRRTDLEEAPLRVNF